MCRCTIQITEEVLDGDQITLDESTILLDGRGQLSWTDHERLPHAKAPDRDGRELEGLPLADSHGP